MLKVFRFSLAALLFGITLSLYADTFNPDSVLGFWMTGEGKAKVQIFRVGAKYFGKIVWLKTPTYDDGTPKVDKHNPDPAQRQKPLIGRVILREFVYDKDDEEYQDGYIYDPESGNEYSSYMSFNEDKTLHVRGYIGFSLIGRTQTWTRTN